MTLTDFISQLDIQANTVAFADTMAVIDAHYIFTPTQFSNGGLVNEADQNNGSCKIFAFGLVNGLSEQQTLACFGTYYRDDVVKNPNGGDHQNIRKFIKSGWSAIQFDGRALAKK